MGFNFKVTGEDLDSAVDEAISDAEHEFIETGKTIDAYDAFAELEKKYFKQYMLSFWFNLGLTRKCRGNKCLSF